MLIRPHGATRTSICVFFAQTGDKNVLFLAYLRKNLYLCRQIVNFYNCNISIS